MPRIEINYVCETETAVDTFNDVEQADDNLFQLVDKLKFIELCQAFYPDAFIDAEKLWHNIMGNHPEDEQAGLHPDVHYLTQSSAEKILTHYHLFTNGIDYQNLASGFFMTRNPAGAGVRDVLHYSEFVAVHQANPSPFAVIVSDKGEIHPLLGTREYPAPQALWYQFLCSKASSQTAQYCSQDELDKAFVQFSNLVESLDLSFYEPNFNQLNNHVNPIVLMARWVSLLRNPHLKLEDLNAQWQCILNLPLINSHEGIRALTDYRRSKGPCGFLLPEMNCTHLLARYYAGPYVGVKSVLHYQLIYSEKDFWRYLAYQPKRNSIGFYKEALTLIVDINLNGEQQSLLCKMLAASTSDVNHRDESMTEEDELHIWRELCLLIKNITTRNVVLIAINQMSPGNLQQEFLRHLTRLNTQPNLVFMSSVAEHIAQALSNLGMADLGKIAVGVDPLEDLYELSEKLNSIIYHHGSKVYQGARFYFKNGAWDKMNLKTYIELQQDVQNIHQLAAPYLIPHLSTFDIQNQATVLAILQFIGPATNRAQLEFCLDIFNDAIAALNQDSLRTLIETINQGVFQDDDYEAMLNYLQVHYAPVFPEHYFEAKRQQIQDARLGLNVQQINLLAQYEFTEPARQSIIRIESALVRHDRTVKNEDLVQFNEQFTILNEVIMPDEFEIFLERMVSIREQIVDKEDLETLLSLLIQEKSLLNFNGIFLREKIIACERGNLLQKIRDYISSVAHINGQNLSISPIKLQETMAALLLKLTPVDMARDDYKQQIIGFIDSLYQIIRVHPHIQDSLIKLINELSAEDLEAYLPVVRELFDKLALLHACLPAGEGLAHKDNMTTIYSLITHFSKKPGEFMALLALIASTQDEALQYFFLNFASKLLDSDASLARFDELFNLCLDNPLQFELLQRYCERPPYPGISQALTWLNEGDFEAQYESYSQAPFASRRLQYTFKPAHYDKQAALFLGLSPDFFTDLLADTLQSALESNRQKSIQLLRDELAALSSEAVLTDDDSITLLCLCVEFLARTCHQHDVRSPTGLASQELNTTQVMTLCAMVLQDDARKILNQIDTGEGKSRIMMVLAAFKALRGKTVDFITSDMQLAMRDFFVYRQFFTAVGVHTSMISLKTPALLYQKSGVNFSDNAQLLLLRNKSDIEQRPFDYLDEDKQNRCLLLDEADRFLHDKGQDAYNFATKSRRLSAYLWIYPHLVHYMKKQQDHLSYIDGKADFEALIDGFANYCLLHDTNLAHLASIAELQQSNPEQLTIWLQSAHTALHMENLRDYVVTEAGDDKLLAVRDHEGFTRYTRKVLVLDNGRPMEGSAFADGVNQCLSVIENEKSAHADAFVILAENEVQRSSFTKTFVAQYTSLYGVSGTTRSDAARANPFINRDHYNYIVTPREQLLIRDDKNIVAAKDEAQQISFIKRQILKAIRQEKSFLLICKDDQQSARINDALKADIDLLALIHRWQHVHSLTSDADEKEAIHLAGEACALTVSTSGMFARGVDINAEHMEVLAAYVPSFEDEIQIKGRSGRFGRPGGFRMIANVHDEDRPFNGRTYRIENEVNKLQQSMAFSAVRQEQVASIYAEFLEAVHQAFLQEYSQTAKINQLKMLGDWQDFLAAMQKDWTLKQKTLIDLFESGFDAQFSSSFKTFSEKWLDKAPAQIKVNTEMNDELAQEVYQNLLAHKGFFKPIFSPIKTQANYDVSDDGQARIYSSLFVQTRAVLRGERAIFADFHAWRDERGALFPDLMATLYGDRPLFANLRATISRLINALIEWVKGLQRPQVEGDDNLADDAALPVFG